MRQRGAYEQLLSHLPATAVVDKWAIMFALDEAYDIGCDTLEAELAVAEARAAALREALDTLIGRITVAEAAVAERAGAPVFPDPYGISGILAALAASPASQPTTREEG